MKLISTLCSLILITACSDSNDTETVDPFITDPNPPVVNPAPPVVTTNLDGDGVLPRSLCENAPIAGALAAQDLIDLGLIANAPVVYMTGGFVADSQLCNIQQEIDATEDGVELPLFLSYIEDSDRLQDLLERINSTNESRPDNPLPFIEKTVDGYDVLIVDSTFATAHIRSTQTNGLISTLTVNWIPETIGFTGDSLSQIQTLESLVDLMIERGISFEPRELPSPTAWYVCNDNSLGVAGADPVELMSILGANTTNISVDMDTTIIGSEECQAIVETPPLERDYFIETEVFDTNRFGTDPIQEFLDRNSTAVTDTIGGKLVAVHFDEDRFPEPEAVVLARDGNVTVRVTARVPEEQELQLPNLVRAVAEEILSRIPF